MRDSLLLDWWRREIAGSSSRRDDVGDLERRGYSGGVELRQTVDGVRVVGYAAVFDSPSGNLGGFVEVIRPGAFTESLRSGDVVALWQHKSELPLARMKAGTLKLREDRRGLAVDFILPNNTWGNDAAESIRRGDVVGMSFGFTVPAGGDSWDRSGAVPVRTLRNVNLFDVSPVTFPAYLSTSVSLATRQAALLRVPRAGGRRGDWRTNNLREWFRWAALG